MCILYVIKIACPMRDVNAFESHVRNSHRGVLHADREDRPLYRASQSVRPLGPL